MRSCVTLAIAIAVAAVAACRDVPTAPTPPTGHLLTNNVWPGDTVLIVSPEAAAAPESAWVVMDSTAQLSVNVTLPDSMLFPVWRVDDSTVALRLPGHVNGGIQDTVVRAGYHDVVLHTPGGFADAGTVHVYGLVVSSWVEGPFTGAPLPVTPGGHIGPWVTMWGRDGVVLLDLATEHVFTARAGTDSIGAEGRNRPCGFGPASYGAQYGLGPSYRAADDWVASCHGAIQLNAPRDSLPWHLREAEDSDYQEYDLAEIGPGTLLVLTSAYARSGHVEVDGSVTPIDSIPLLGGGRVVISPTGDRAVVERFAVESGGDSPGVPVFDDGGHVAYKLFAGYQDFWSVAAGFSTQGDSLFVSIVQACGNDCIIGVLYFFDARDGRRLDSNDSVVFNPPGYRRWYADPNSDYLYGQRGGLGGLWAVRRTPPHETHELKSWCGAEEIVGDPTRHQVMSISGIVYVLSFDDQAIGPVYECTYDVP